MDGSTRIDKWLWAVRLYKTRSLATAACTAGKVRIGDQPVKPSRAVRVGEILTAVTGHVTRTIKVLGIIDRRVGAKLVSEHLEDLTPPAEYERARDEAKSAGLRPKGMGRPTKKQRRSLEQFFATPPPGFDLDAESPRKPE